MTYFHQQLLQISAQVYPKAYLARQIIGAKSYIDAHFADKLTVASIAQEAFLSKFHFIRLFKLYYGRTPYQYLTDVRIRQAKRLLQTDTSIEAVCFAVGFESVSSFTALFKNLTGSTPSAFRNTKKTTSVNDVVSR